MSKIKLKSSNGGELSLDANALLSKSKNVVYLDTVEQTTQYVGNDGDVIHISDVDRGGVFVYDSTATDNGGTVFGKCVRQYEGAVNVKWFADNLGQPCGSGNDDTAGIKKALLLKNLISDENITYNIKEGLEITNKCNIDFKNSTLKVNSPSIAALYSYQAFNTQISNLVIDCDNQTSSTGMEMVNFRHASSLSNVSIVNADIGYHAKELCWNTQYYGVRAINCNTGYIIEEGSNGCVFNQCSADGCVTGFIVRDGTTYPVTNVKFIGGFAQNCSGYGFEDYARSTRIDSMYFEKCTNGDILLSSALFPTLENTYHSGTKGAVCVKGSNTSGASIKNIVYDGSRTGDMFDFDTSNIHAYAEYQRTGTLSVALGITDGIKIFNNLSGTNVLGDIGADNGIIKAITGDSPASYTTRSLTNGFNIEYNLGANTDYNANLGHNAVHKTCGGATDITISNFSVGQEVIFILKASSGYTSGDITIAGKTINMTGAGADKYTMVKVYNSGLYVKVLLSSNVWNS